MDDETKKVISQQEHLKGLIEHTGWAIARKKLVDRILELQMVGDIADSIEESNALNFMIAVKANKKAAEALFDFLKSIESEAEALEENKQLIDKTYIVKL